MSSVDVIVPCYRYGHYLQECVKSVLDQQGVDVRVLIIDDASPDHTAEVARALCARDSRVHFIRHAVNMRHIATYNEGIEWLSAQYYLLLSADDYLLPGALARSVALLDAHPSVVLAYGEAITLNAGDRAEFAEAASFGNDWEVMSGLEFMRRSGATNCVPTPTAIVRTEVQKRIGGYRPELPHSGDMELWLRLAAHGDVAVTKACHAVYRRHATNMSSAYWVESRLPDLRQRKAAVDFFLSHAEELFPEAEEIYSRCLRLLAEEAVGFASGAFNRGELAVARELSRFAMETDPGVRKTRAWMTLACKERVGFRRWSAMKASMQGLRRRLSLRDSSPSKAPANGQLDSPGNLP